MSDKTVIDEIRARDKKPVRSYVGSLNQVIEDGKAAITDRATLLSILAEVGALPGRWKPKISGRGLDHKTSTATKRRVLTPGQCARELKTILNRTGNT